MFFVSFQIGKPHKNVLTSLRVNKSHKPRVSLKCLPFIDVTRIINWQLGITNHLPPVFFPSNTVQFVEKTPNVKIQCQIRNSYLAEILPTEISNLLLCDVIIIEILIHPIIFNIVFRFSRGGLVYNFASSCWLYRLCCFKVIEVEIVRVCVPWSRNSIFRPAVWWDLGSTCFKMFAISFIRNVIFPNLFTLLNPIIKGSCSVNSLFFLRSLFFCFFERDGGLWLSAFRLSFCRGRQRRSEFEFLKTFRRIQIYLT